jgi:hypothetical protein
MIFSLKDKEIVMLTNSGNRNCVRVVLFIGVILTMVACKKENSVSPPAQLTTSFTGITHTDSTGFGVVGSADSSDWKSISIGRIQYILHPAYPNPCSAGKGCVVAWWQQSQDSVVITLNDSPSHILATFISQRLDSGQYAYSLHNHLNGFQPAIYRLYFHVVKADSTYTTYGDIQIN